MGKEDVMTSTRVLLEGEAVRVPEWVNDLESFRRWTDDDAFPESGQISFLEGEVWIDMSKEQLFSHNQVKTEVTRVLASLVKEARLGRYFSDGAYLSNVAADVSNQPDSIFATTESFAQRRVIIVEGRMEGHVELEGSPDWVLEIVSRSSVEKDTEVLRRAYAGALVREYWLVDARGESLKFDVLRLNRGSYTAVRKRASWVRSDVFDRFFRLARQDGPDGYPEFTLEVTADRPA
jgi:Uma2 family endonuclease